MNYEVNDFTIDVLERSHETPVLVDFWAEWCAPCRTLSPVLESLGEKNKDKWILVKVNTENHPDIAAKYSISSIPNVKLFIDGKVANEFVGALPENTIVQWLRKAIPGKYQQQIESAQKLLSEQKTDEAQKLLFKIVEAEPDNQQAKVLYAQATIFSDHEKAVELVKGIVAGAEYYDIAEMIDTFDDLFQKADRQADLPDGPAKEQHISAINDLRSRNFDSALEKFIDVIRKDRHYDEDGSRKACIAIFRFLGENHESTQKHRRDFSGALYV